MTSKLFILIQYLCCITLAMPIELQAQSARHPNPAEVAVIQKAINIVTPFIDAFANNNWEKVEGGGDDIQYVSIQKNPDVVMGVAPFNDWHFRVKPGSDYYNDVIKPLMDKIPEADLSNATGEKITEYLKTVQQLNQLTDLYVEVHVNKKNLPEKLFKGAKGDLNILGTSYAFQEKQNRQIPTIRDGIKSYILAFGNWSTSTLDKKLNVYQFHFTHAFGSPYIENIIIKISGNEERIQQLFKTADWNIINAALTK